MLNSLFDYITLALLVLPEVQQSLGPLAPPIPHSDLVYRRIPSSLSPPSLPSQGRDRRAKVLLFFHVKMNLSTKIRLGYLKYNFTFQGTKCRKFAVKNQSIRMFDCSVCVGYLVFLSLLSLLHDRLCLASQEYLSMERSINKQSKNKNRCIYTVYLHLYITYLFVHIQTYLAFLASLSLGRTPWPPAGVWTVRAGHQSGGSNDGA